MQWLIPLATAVWAVWKWSQDREKDRRVEQERAYALYITPFLSACEDLQSRIYNILEREGLCSLRKRYPDGAYAEETLYIMVRFFGWLATMLRYGLNPQDRQMIQLTESVREAFSTSKHPVGPFAVFRSEQRALGKLVMTRFKGQYGIEYDTISFYEFRSLLGVPPLSESQSLKQSLDALRTAQDALSLPGRERLAEAQGHLVDLLRYQEARVGLSFFPGERKKCPRLLERSVPALLESASAPATGVEVT
jgi:hypothetical protein